MTSKTITKTETKKVGRPSVVTDRVVTKLLEAFKMDCTVSEACVYAEIPRRSYYTWLEANPEYKHTIADLRDYVLMKARKNITTDITEKKNVDTSKWYAERKKKQEFSPRTEVTGAEGKDIAFTIKEDTSLLLEGETVEGEEEVTSIV